MKSSIEAALNQAVAELIKDGTLPAETSPKIQLTRTKDPAHGAFATNLALMLAKPAGMAPRQLAEKLVALIPLDGPLEKLDIAGPGFINFFVSDSASKAVIADILSAGENYGLNNSGQGEKVHLEYVSANPTGPLHVGHGRGAAYGSVLAALLQANGYQVHQEYYVNDAGRQMHILATSIYLRYLQASGAVLTFPVNGYKGEYVKDIAASFQAVVGESFLRPVDAVFANARADEIKDSQGAVVSGDKEKHIDDLIKNTKASLGAEDYQTLFQHGLKDILSGIEADLDAFGTHHDQFYSEQGLKDSGAITEAIKRLDAKGFMFEEGGAQWFRSTQFGDDKDRVVVRENGETTYFASDIAYHMEKLDRGYTKVINILGADHHGYVPRVKAAMEALGANSNQLHCPLVQFAILYRGGKRVPMSTRSGSFVTLKDLADEVGKDAARFFYVMRKVEQHMDFDLDLAKSNSKENPVYYVQYAHARICAMMRNLEERDLSFDESNGLANAGLLDNELEQDLIRHLERYAELIVNSGQSQEPHLVTNYLRELAAKLHSFYNDKDCNVLKSAKDLRDARVSMVLATRQVLANGLTILGVSAPESM